MQYFNLLIEPFGIEIALRVLQRAEFTLLIEPFGIEIAWYKDCEMNDYFF